MRLTAGACCYRAMVNRMKIGPEIPGTHDSDKEKEKGTSRRANGNYNESIIHGQIMSWDT